MKWKKRQKDATGRIEFDCAGQRLSVPTTEDERKSSSLLDLAISHDVPVHHSCGGMGSCGTCRVVILAGAELLPPRTELEAEMAKERNFSPQERLACQLPVLDGLLVGVPEDEI